MKKRSDTLAALYRKPNKQLSNLAIAAFSPAGLTLQLPEQAGLGRFARLQQGANRYKNIA